MIRKLFIVVSIIVVLILAILVYFWYSCSFNINYEKVNLKNIFNDLNTCISGKEINKCSIEKQQCSRQVKDDSGNSYATILLTGKNCYARCWMIEDLRNKKEINKENYKKIRNRAYYKYSAVEKGICPEGWHIPSKNEWGEARTKVKDFIPKMNLRLGGYWNFKKGVNMKNQSKGHYWSSSKKNKESAWNLYVLNEKRGVVNSYNKNYGFLLRCVKDNK